MCGIALVADLRGRSSRAIVAQALAALANLRHRGAVGHDGRTGDGAGIMLQIPHAFLEAELAKTGVSLPTSGDYGVGMLFMPKDEQRRARLMAAVEAASVEAGLRWLAWRQVPTRSAVLGTAAAESEPSVWQVFVASPDVPCAAYEIDAQLFRMRRLVERAAADHGAGEAGGVTHTEGEGGGSFYICSLSARTIVYKGMLLPDALAAYFPDLNDARVRSGIAIVHSRFSTNTASTWRLAQPFRGLCHNGEINTIRGNLAWMRARQGAVAADLFGQRSAEVLPLIADGQSDSACLDDALEALTLADGDMAEALVKLIPPAWEKNTWLPPKVRALHEWQATVMEPWDGPAAVAFSDGRIAGVAMDRNGLRPCRYVVTRDDLVIMSSEAGAVPVALRDLKTSGRVGPGEMLLVDTRQGRLIDDRELKARAADRHDYRAWLGAHLRNLADLPPPPEAVPVPSTPAFAQVAFGYTREEVAMVLTPMATTGEEPISSMGDDVPPAVLLAEARPLFDYFRQQFAQVTNPPIDPIREDAVMSMTVLLGPKGSPCRPPLTGGDGTRLVRLAGPVLLEAELLRLRQHEEPGYAVSELPLLFDAAGGVAAFAAALSDLQTAAAAAVQGGATLLILSDRGVDAEHAALPSLLAVAAVHHHLIRQGLRHQACLIVEAGDARTVHHAACLVGYGAAALCPYLALEIARRQPLGDQNLVKAMTAGLKKIMSKMGIATLASYTGAQVFEALGLGPDLIALAFPGTASPLGGMTLAQLGDESLARHRQATALADRRVTALPVGGMIHYRTQGEPHGWTPDAIASLQQATKTASPVLFEQFTAAVDGVPGAPKALRHLLALRPAPTPVPLAEVESAAAIVRRFTTGAMSLGAISREAHETLAVAMNRLQAKSNTGEGGEDPARFVPAADGTSRNSAIKQVASGRFGVTIHYLVNAEELQIKIAQGAKPGEGGQLPGAKVDESIASLRFSTPGVQLISPPPHHDIYSIEDLAQLIHDLKEANPKAKISVKLVAESGIGAIAVGVAKARADKIVVAGDGGGTGASPLSSIKHAGMPWEVGLAEVHQALLASGLRDRVRVETDGQLRTGRDVVIAALLGADELGFATAPLIVQGCIMMRKCHLNTCPVGIATQDPELRAKFTGMPEHVINYFFLVAEQVRALMATLGLRQFAAMVGATELLEPCLPATLPKLANLDLAPLLNRPRVPAAASARQQTTADDGASAFDRRVLEDCQPALAEEASLTLSLPITTAERTTGTRVASAVALEHGAGGLPVGRIDLDCRGYAGQSFGAFLAPGMTLRLTGLANDYVGKGLSGGTVIVHLPTGTRLEGEAPVLAGNTTLYGATAGSVFIAGGVGERFAVRNSGALAVVEATGDHACEYMTGGLVLVLGATGRNFAAGMSGGLAYVYDEDGFFSSRCNPALVELERLVTDPTGPDSLLLRQLVTRHLRLTGSAKAHRMLSNWPRVIDQFVKVVPKDLKAMAAARGVSAASLARLPAQLAPEVALHV